MIHKGASLDSLVYFHLTQLLNHIGRQDCIGIEKKMSFPSSSFCPYTGRPAGRFLNSASSRVRPKKNIAIISPHPDRYAHIWTGYAVFFLLSSHFKDLYLPAFPTY